MNDKAKQLLERKNALRCPNCHHTLDIYRRDELHSTIDWEPVAGVSASPVDRKSKIVSGDIFLFEGKHYQFRGQDAQGVYHAQCINPRGHVTFQNADGWELFWSARGDQ